MLIVLGLYFALVWIVLSKLKILPWNAATKGAAYTGALVIALVVIGALNHITPSGRVSPKSGMAYVSAASIVGVGQFESGEGRHGRWAFTGTDRGSAERSGRAS